MADIELAPVLGLLRRLGVVPVLQRARRHGSPVLEAWTKQRRVGRRMIDRPPVAALLGARGIGEDDDGRLEALGAVHGHHPHAGAVVGELALDGDLARAQFGEEAEQRGLRRLLVREREVEELGRPRRRSRSRSGARKLRGRPRHRARRRRSRTAGRNRAGCASRGAARRRLRTEAGRAVLQRRHGRARPAARLREGEQVLLADVEQRRAQQGGELQVVGAGCCSTSPSAIRSSDADMGGDRAAGRRRASGRPRGSARG